MTEYRKLHIPKYPEVGEKAGEETRFWKKFQAPILIKEYGSVSAIHFSPAAPHDFAIASSARVQVYSSKTNSPKKTISRFKDVAHSVSFRNDGQLIVAGDATGLVQVFDVNSRAILRTFREHTLPVHVTQFASDKTHILTASDDRTVRLWDIPAGGSVNVLEGHEDYVRAGVVSNDNPNLLLTGSYDRTVRLWDARQNQCVMTMQHDAPVESVLMYPGGGAVISAGGPMIKVWDLLSGGRCMHVASNHQKTVTSMCFDESASRLVTGSLDHHVKIYNVQDYKVVYNIKYTAPVMSVGLSPNNTHLVAGMANGLLAIRQRPLTAEEQAAKKQKQMMNSSKYKAFLRGQTTVATDEDFVVEGKRRKKLAAYDKYLKKYEHHNALDAVLRNPQPPTVIAMIIELRVRHALVSALSGRDDVALEPMVQFILKWIHHPRYTNILVEVTDLILDIYSPVLGQSPLIDDLLRNLAKKVEQEIALQKDIIQTKAALEMLFASAGTNALANDLE